jgi:hypothetical protein
MIKIIGDYTMRASKTFKAIQKVRRIIQDMSEVKDMYRITLFVSKSMFAARRNHKATTEMEALAACGKEYDKKHKIASRFSRPRGDKKVMALYMAEKHGFIDYGIDSEDKKTVALYITKKGYQLIATKWFGLNHCGLREQTLKAYPRTREVYKVKYAARIGAIGVLLGAVIGAIGTYIGTRLQ